MHHQLITCLEDMELIRPSWERLVNDNPDCSFFMTYDWAYNWLKIFGRSIFIIAVKDKDDIIAIAPLAIKEHRLGIWKRKVMGFIGDPDNDSSCFILSSKLDSKSAASCIKHIFQVIMDSRDIWDKVVLGEMLSDSRYLDMIESCLQRLHIYYTKEESNVCYFHQVMSKETDLKNYDKKNIKKKRNRLKNQGKLCFELVSSDPLNTLAEMRKQHIKRWKGRGVNSFFEDERYVSLFLELMHSAGKDAVNLARLYFEGQGTIASVLCFRIHDRCTFYINSFDDMYSKYGPSLVLFTDTILALLNDGIKGFDFGRGDEAYKKYFTDDKQKIFTFKIRKKKILVKGDKFIFLIKQHIRKNYALTNILYSLKNRIFSR